MTLTFYLNLDEVKMNRHPKYLGQRSFCSKLIVHTDKHIELTDCCIWSTEVVDNDESPQQSIWCSI